MASDLARNRAYRSTMDRLEATKSLTPKGVEYWRARDVMGILGYVSWENFDNVIEKARRSFEGNSEPASHHIHATKAMMGVGKGAMREAADHILSRAACYLVAMNGDPSKPEIAAAQAYFAIQTRTAELAEQEAKDQKRVAVRERVTKALKRVTDVARDVGVRRYALFHDARYRGLYGAGAKDVCQAKGLESGESLLDRAGPLELSAHEFQGNLAAETILNRGISGEAQAIATNLEVARDVRDLMERKAGRKPEDLPLEPEPIQAVRKRITTHIKGRKALGGRS